uniref:LysA n=1 Tax=Hematodinium sp. SG-2015 TaxID=1649283 RepID=A0A0F7EW04_9DINO|nr:LysA [Hematodinium sp. SG-2015]|eukprot:GEMP01034720.1.p1 GENE.GEMP01034720.1~~GEMP01034720.1.p1  ORF type:complete len:450 (+),score=117.80 GEMP01034720.1:280-1629(+)
MSKELIIPAEETLALAEKLPTPFHIYHEGQMRETARKMKAAYSWAPNYRNYFAVKATPNPTIVKILVEEGMGTDCSSLAELMISEALGLRGEQIMFTSNNTPLIEYTKAKELGAIINFDDITQIEYVKENLGLPDLVCFRYNPGESTTYGNVIIGVPQEAKFGLTREQIFKAVAYCKEHGVTRFGMHTMVVSNCIDAEELKQTAKMIFGLVKEIKQRLSVDIEFCNLGGGIGVAYKLQDTPPDFSVIATGIREHYEEILVPCGLKPNVVTECGRCVTGPAGALVTRVIHRKKTYKNYVGVDACMADLMRPSLYGSYHHITILPNEKPVAGLASRKDLPPSVDMQKGKEDVYDVVGSLCENNDKLAVDRSLSPMPRPGDVAVIHDAGAHGHAMGFNYNGKLRSAEYLYRGKDDVVEIRRRETYDNLFATLPNGAKAIALDPPAKKRRTDE